MEERTIEELQNLGDGNGVLGLGARLGVDPHKGLSNAVPDWSARVETYGANIFEERKLTPYWDFSWDSSQGHHQHRHRATGVIC